MENWSKKQTVRTSVSLSRRDYADLGRIASQKKVSVAWVIRDAVDRYLEAENPLFRQRAVQ